MGASGTDTFDDDDAMDWIGTFLDAPSEELIYETLERARPDCESGSASHALAAAEVVAFLRGAPSSGLLQMLEAHDTETVPLKRSPRLERLAIDTIDNISAASELRDLWEEVEGWLPEWLAALDDLKSRLTSSPTVSS